MKKRKVLMQRMEHRNQWKQISLKSLEFFTEIETVQHETQTMTTKKRTIKIVRQEAMKRVKKIQLNFEQFTIQ